VKGVQAIITMPRIADLRSMIMNHNINHRAQLGVY
ncbi:MAG: damage-inducible protein DinB, partial [Acidobacteria bacterium]|nr:damage-inducible protein DinB [Acidobacteriota bacterium]